MNNSPVYDPTAPVPSRKRDENKPYFLEYLIFFLSIFLIGTGIYIVCFVLKELYVTYQNPISGTFITNVTNFFTNETLYMSGNGDYPVTVQPAFAKIMSYFLFFFFAAFATSFGKTLITYGISIIPKISRRPLEKKTPQPPLENSIFQKNDTNTHGNIEIDSGKNNSETSPYSSNDSSKT